MPRTITALFDTREHAVDAKQQLISAGIPESDVRVLDAGSEGHVADRYSDHQERGVWASIRNAFLPDEDRHAYEEGIRRGGYVVAADVEDAQADGAVAALQNAHGVDIDQRASEWRAEGWGGSGYDQTRSSRTLGSGDAASTGFGGAVDAGARSPDRLSGGRDLDQETIPVVEERLVVGKREVERGGVRVRSYVTETPVHEQIRLREERVQVDRRPVDRPLEAGVDDAFRERTIEMVERAEEAVVGKSARVVEEVAVFKTADERTEEVDDTVRRTEVEVKDVGRERRASDPLDRDRDRPPIAP